MIEKTVTIINKAGMHTRPASNIVKIASKFRSDFFIIKNNYSINGKSIIGVMTLAAEQGSKLTLRFEGNLLFTGLKYQAIKWMFLLLQYYHLMLKYRIMKAR